MTEAAIVRLSIGGEESDATGGRTFTRNNPMTGAPAKCREKRSASMVAEVMMSFRSRLCGTRVFR